MLGAGGLRLSCKLGSGCSGHWSRSEAIEHISATITIGDDEGAGADTERWQERTGCVALRCSFAPYYTNITAIAVGE
jgi:hypothetical protein